MEINDIHTDIKKFIGDLSESNIKSIHEVGSVKSFTFKTPKLTIFFITTSNNLTEYLISFDNKGYREDEFVRMLKMKTFW